MSMRIGACGGIAAGVVLFAATAWAQVAAPPLTPLSFVTDNPAAIQWGSPSRVGGGAIQSQTAIVPASPTQPTYKDNFSGGGGGARFVGQSVSVAGSYAHVDNTHSSIAQSEFSDDSQGALALRLGQHLSLGVGQTSTVHRTYFPPLPLPPVLATFPSQLSEDRHDIPQAGLTIRLGEWLFLGGAAGQDSVKHTDLFVPLNSFKTTRDVTKYGVGIRTGGAVATHFEYYVVEYDKYAKKNLPLGTASGRETSSTGVVEFNFGGVLIGYSASHTDLDSKQPTIDYSRLDLGWAPFSGWSVVGRGELATLKLPQTISTVAGVDKVSTTTYSLLLSYLF